MIDLLPVMERLTAAGLPRVRGVIEYSALESAPALLPAFFVVPLSEAAGPNRLSGVIDQRITVEFQVVVIVAAQAVQRGRASSDLSDQIAAVKACLIAWTIPGTDGPAEYAGGRLLSVGGREAIWSARFRTSYHERTHPQ